MASIRLRKKSNGCIIKSLRNQLSIKRFLGDLVHTIYTKKLVFMRVCEVLQGRQNKNVDGGNIVDGVLHAKDSKVTGLFGRDKVGSS
jgi:hypothetical protein